MIHSEGLADEGTLESLATAVNDHIRFEERTLFPEIEQVVAADQLQKIHDALTRAEKSHPSWPDAFWLKK